MRPRIFRIYNGHLDMYRWYVLLPDDSLKGYDSWERALEEAQKHYSSQQDDAEAGR